MGCGLGFKKQVGEEIDETKIEKIYTIDEEKAANQLETVLSEMSLELIQITNDIVDYAKVSLGKTLPDNIYITLTDHISFALERHRQNIQIKNALLWEIKRFYNHEFAIGLEAVEILNRRLNVQLPEDEAAFIALHFASATLDTTETGQAKQVLDIIKTILTIVKFHFSIELDEESLHYERFVTHLKFFIHRIFSGNELNEDDEDFLLILKTKYKDEYLCTLKVYDYFLKNFDIRLTNDEIMYLTIHIRRITSN